MAKIAKARVECLKCTDSNLPIAGERRESRSYLRSDFGPGFRQYWRFKESLFPARQTLETRNWSAAMKIQPAQDADVMARQVIYWTHAVAAGHLQEQQAAEQALASFNATLNASDLETMTAHPKSQWAETKAWTLFAEGQADAAIALLKPIADVQDELAKGEVDLPAREMVGDMLRLSGRSDDALQEYRFSLQADPGRFDTLLHAAPPAQRALTHASRFLARRRTSLPQQAGLPYADPLSPFVLS